MNFNGFLPREYEDAGYGGPIDFRGFSMLSILAGIPLDLIPHNILPKYDQIDLLSFAYKIMRCNLSHDLFVTLLPVINHPACSTTLYNFNDDIIKNFNGSLGPTTDFRSQTIAGIIRIDAIDKRKSTHSWCNKIFLRLLKRKRYRSREPRSWLRAF